MPEKNTRKITRMYPKLEMRKQVGTFAAEYFDETTSFTPARQVFIFGYLFRVFISGFGFRVSGFRFGVYLCSTFTPARQVGVSLHNPPKHLATCCCPLLIAGPQSQLYDLNPKSSTIKTGIPS